MPNPAASYQLFKHHSLPIFQVLQSSLPTELLTFIQTCAGVTWGGLGVSDRTAPTAAS